MEKENSSLLELKNIIDNNITSITKCYLLINYAYNTEEGNNTYKTEFIKRYDNLYRNIINIDHELEDNYKTSNYNLFKQIIGIDYYKEKMSFLDEEEIDLGLEEENDMVDIDFEIKTSMSQVKLNFYHNNNVEFGNNTRFHVETDKYSSINPKAGTDEEKRFIFETLTNYYKNNLLNKNNKVLKKDM